MSGVNTTEIPETTTVEREGSVVRWTNRDFGVTVEQAEAIAGEIEEHLATADAVLVDNSEATGAWDPEVNDVWTELMGEFAEQGTKSATICPSTVNAHQVNRLSRDAGTEDLIKGFEADEADEARSFVGLD